MIERLIDICARNKTMVFIATGFFVAWGIWAIRTTPIDALPDLSDTQVIVFTEWMGRSADLVEDQISYPIVTAFLAAPKVKLVRGFTMFGMSFVYIVFQDGTDIYWARSRVIEYLAKLQGKLPPGVSPQIGPDATGVGWIFEYALVDDTGQHDLQQLRSFQDWQLRYWLSSVPGVAEVASIGGYEKEYQIELDPVRLQAYNLSISEIGEAVRMSNGDVGGRVIELAGHEYAVRGRGYIKSRDDIAKIVVATNAAGTPVRLGDIARIQVGGNIRRGFAELDGKGETVGGIVVMRFGENALAVIERVKAKLAEMQSAMPSGVRVVTTYDRSGLIGASVNTLTENLAEEMIIVSLVIILFLFHVRSALVPAIVMPIAVIISFIPMAYMHLTTNIMSLAGIIIAIGDVVDSAVVLIENAHKKLEHAGPDADRSELVIQAAKELGPAIFGSLLVIAISFLPVFTLEAQEGRLFKPLAFTKTFAMLFASILSVTLVPPLMVLFVRGKIRPEASNPVNRACMAVYRPVLRVCLKYRWLLAIGTVVVLVLTIVPFSRLGSEFMPPLYEGTLLYMPITVPGISIEAAKQLVQEQDRRLKQFPEVASVFGKAGRAETPTDPAPLSMIETVIALKAKSEWRPGMTLDRLTGEMSDAVTMPGLQNAWTMPIKARVDMLTTGIRTPIGVKIFGPDLGEIAKIGESLESILRSVPGTRSVYAEREMGGFYVDFIPDRDAIARYGLRLMDVMNVVETAIGGLDLDTTVEGRERYRINVRYPRELRDSPEALARVLVPIPRQRANQPGMPADQMKQGGPDGAMSPGERVAHVRLGQLGRIVATMGPPMIKDEGGSLSGWVYVDTTSRDIGGYVDNAKRVVARELKLKPGYFLKWTGQYEFLERARARMQIVIPLTVGIILMILYVNFGGWIQALLVLFSVPCAAMGSIWLMYALGYNTSIAVWVGLIALLGVAAETASIMVIYLDEGYRQWLAEGRLRSRQDLVQMTHETAVARVRPLLMAVGMNIFGLIPIMFATGIGSDVAKRIAAPLWGGLVSLTVLTLMVIPAIYVIWREHGLASAQSRQT
ncbi:MAG: CusA/CzcA family heavy metal efflux RND transporter [Candidatus Binatus sp.]|uniref:efflux RND transporter permease subunit n=1 Tax=Candidatus Binatus sp. TaxID=2811406 RepID=UPI0027165ED2|nr:CusA/CzcA family heavy metal efflux RND transporter [Candidatus Binatus sp.]MDO8433716.1 CusA/CzcA family heavy metal efflux RND transporter [Candidatus Binatus sp.]